MPDRILLRSIEFYGYHGVTEDERRIGHRFSLDVTLELDLAPAGESDDLRDGVDYADVCRTVLEIAEGAPVRLLERLATLVAERCLQRYPAVIAVEVLARKLLPPLPATVSAVAVTIRRMRAAS